MGLRTSYWVIQDNVLTAHEDAFKRAEENILAAQRKQKETYDRKQVLFGWAHIQFQETLGRVSMS